MSPERLAKFDGSKGSPGIFLAVFGTIYDVRKGKQHYDPDGPYNVFAGKDATKALTHFDLSKTGPDINVEELTNDHLSEIDNWRAFFDNKYPKIGVVYGHYYDKYGNKTEELIKVEEAIQKAKEQ